MLIQKIMAAPLNSSNQIKLSNNDVTSSLQNNYNQSITENQNSVSFQGKFSLRNLFSKVRKPMASAEKPTEYEKRAVYALVTDLEIKHAPLRTLEESFWERFFERYSTDGNPFND